jgi:hypothetical protein
MRERGGRDAEPRLQLAHSLPKLAGANKGAVDLEPGRIAEGFQPGCCFVYLHSIENMLTWRNRQSVFPA